MQTKGGDVSTSPAEQIIGLAQMILDCQVMKRESQYIYDPTQLNQDEPTEFELWLDSFEAALNTGDAKACEQCISYLRNKATRDSLLKPEWLVPGVLLKGGITLLYGDAGAGKTSFAIQLAASLIAGEPTLGLSVQKCLPVLIEQDEFSTIEDHKEKMAKVFPVVKDVKLADRLVLWDNREYHFNRELDVYSALWDVVIIDAYTALGIEDINLPKTALVWDNLRGLARQYGCSFLVLHHSNKNGGQMGSKIVEGKADCVLKLAKGEKNEVELRADKVRGTHTDVLRFSFHAETLTFRPVITKSPTLKGQLKSQVNELIQQGCSRDDIISKLTALGHKRATIKRYLSSLSQRDSLAESESY